MALNREDVKRLAELARLELTDEENERARQELDQILRYVDRLQHVDTQGIPEVEAGDGERPLASDVALPCDEVARELILANFPERVGDLLKVPAVFEKPKG